jgi:hypothetical protein
MSIGESAARAGSAVRVLAELVMAAAQVPAVLVKQRTRRNISPKMPNAQRSTSNFELRRARHCHSL